AVVLFLVIRAQGEGLSAPPPSSAAPVAAVGSHGNVVLQLLVALTAVIVTGQLPRRLFARIGQPPGVRGVGAGALPRPAPPGSGEGTCPRACCRRRSLPCWAPPPSWA